MRASVGAPEEEIACWESCRRDASLKAPAWPGSFDPLRSGTVTRLVGALPRGGLPAALRHHGPGAAVCPVLSRLSQPRRWQT